MALNAEQKQKAKKIINIITTVIFAVVFVCLVVVFAMVSVQRKSGKDVKIFGHYMLAVLTDSMSPTIEPNEVIWSKVAEEEDIIEGAIVTFTAPSGPLKGHNETHRISRIVEDEDGTIKIYTKGDNEQSEDPWTIEKDDIKAVYVRKLPLVSAIMGFVIKYPFWAYITLIAVPLLVVAIMFIVGFVKDRLKKQREEEQQEISENTNLSDLSEEDKKKLLEAYLASTNGSKNEGENLENFEVESPENSPENNGENDTF